MDGTTKEQILEVSVFLFLLAPSLLLSSFARAGGINFRLEALASILRDLSLLCLILFWLWRNGESWRRIGWVPEHVGRELLLGIALWFPFTVLSALCAEWFRSLGLSSPHAMPAFLIPHSGLDYLLGFLLVLVVAVTEETVFRGYLILRLSLHRYLRGVLLSSVVFALGHGWEGSAGVMTTGVMGVLFALIYLWRKSLWAPIAIHFLQDFLGILILPLG